MPLDPPRSLETARLLLRPWRPDDLAAFIEALDESVASLRPWVPWARSAPLDPAESSALVTKWAAEFDAGVNFVYATTSRTDGSLVGGVGLYPRVGPGAIEIGYWIRSARAGQGLATEASRALTEAGFALAAVDRIEMHCAWDNHASRRVPEKLGYRLHPAGGDLAVYQLSRTSWTGGGNGSGS